MCNLTYVSSTFETSSFFPNPLFIVCSVLQDGTENASRKVARKNRMGAGERRVLKMEPLRIDCLPFTWANLSVHGLGKWLAKFRTGKLLPESRLPFVQISSLYRKTAAKASNWYQRWLWRNGTRISVWNIPSRKNGTTFSDVPLLPDSFHWNNPKAVFHLLSIRIFRNLFVK